VIAIDHYINGRTLTDSIHMFPGMMERVFKRWSSLIPFLSRAFELSASYLHDGLYSADNIETVLKKAFGTDKHILDCSYATSTGTKVGLPLATVSRHPSYRIFTNYNGVGIRDKDQGTFLKASSEVTLKKSKTGTSSSQRKGLGKCRFGRCKGASSHPLYL
jgi:hypothetical protein